MARRTTGSRSRGRGAPPASAAAIPALALPVGFAAAAALWWFGYPGALVLWVSATVYAWAVQPPELTGKDPLTKEPIPAGAREQKQYRRYRFASVLKWSLVLPYSAFFPGWPVYGSFLAGLVGGGIVWGIPHADLPVGVATVLDPVWLRHIDAFFVFVVIAQWFAAKRYVAGDQVPCPGVRIDSLVRLGTRRKGETGPRTQNASALPPGPAQVAAAIGNVMAKTGGVLGGLGRLAPYACGIATAALTGWILTGLLPTPPVADLPGVGFVLAPAAGAFWWVFGALAGFGLGVSIWWVKAALAAWRISQDAAAEWGNRWQMLSQKSPPRLLDRKFVGEAIVDTFRSDGGTGSAIYFAMGTKITPTLGGGRRCAVLPVADVDGSGQPIEGSLNPLDFQIVTWPNDYAIDPTAPVEDTAELSLFLACAVSWATGQVGQAPIVLSIDPIPLAAPPMEEATPGSTVETDDHVDAPAAAPPQAAEPEQPPVAYAARLSLPLGPDWNSLRTMWAGAILGQFGGGQMIVDNRAQTLYLGVLTDEGLPEFEGGASRQHLRDLAEEDTWNGRTWKPPVLKNDANPPTFVPQLSQEAKLAGGQTLLRRGFATRQGFPPSEFFGLVPKVAATMSAPTFLSITGHLSGHRPGDRHDQAFNVTWSKDPVPSNPDALAPMPTPGGPRHGSGGPGGPISGGESPRRGRPRPGRAEKPVHTPAHQWLLGGLVNQAFAAAKMPQPEVYSVRCLTSSRSRGHMWVMNVRLYGVTLADVRSNAQRLRQAWGSEWLRVAHAPDGCVIVAGASPRRVDFATPADEQFVAKLDWDYAFLTAKVTGDGGMTPVMTEVDRLPDNPKVHIYDFDLPAGVTLQMVRAARAQLEQVSENAYVDPRPHPSKKPNQIRMLVCETHPMPERVAYQWDAETEKRTAVPFATGVEGAALVFDVHAEPHLMIAGTSGGGKSAASQNILFGALVRGMDVVVVDVQKGAADFKFAADPQRFGTDHLAGLATDYISAEAMMKAVYAEVKRRVAINSEHGVGHVKELPPSLQPRPMIVFLDEFLGLISAGTKPSTRAEDDPDLERQRLEATRLYQAKKQIGYLAGRIAAEARSADVHLILATQRLTANSLPTELGDLKTNLARILLGKATQGERMSALRDPESAPPLGEYVPRGRGIWESTLAPAVMAQFWFAEAEDYAEHLRDLMPPIDPARKVDITPFLQNEKDPAAEAFGAIINGEPGTAPAVAPDGAVDLGAFEFDLEDLELDPDDLGLTLEELETRTSPATSLPQTARPQTVEAAPDESTVEVGSSIDFGEIDPTPWQPAESEYGWSEIDALVGFLDEFAQVDPKIEHVTWTDTRLLEPGFIGVPMIDLVADLLDERNIGFTGPAPATTSAQAPAPALVQTAAPITQFASASVVLPAPVEPVFQPPAPEQSAPVVEASAPSPATVRMVEDETTHTTTGQASTVTTPAAPDTSLDEFDSRRTIDARFASDF